MSILRSCGASGQTIAGVAAISVSAIVASSVGCAADGAAPKDAPPSSQHLDPDGGVEAAASDDGPKPCVAEFCPVTTPTDARVGFHAIWGTGAEDVWAAGSRGTVIHFDGTSWNTLSPGGNSAFYAINGTAQEVYVASTGMRLFRAATGAGAETLDDVGWTGGTSTSGNKEARVWSLAAMSDGTIVAAGDSLSRFTYVDEQTGEYFVSSVSLRVSEGTTEDGKPIWRPIECRDETGMGGAKSECFEMEIRAVWGTSASDLVVAGVGGRLRRIQGLATGGDGSEIYWSNLATNVDANLNGIWGTSTDDFLVVGDRGTVLRSDGYTASPVAIGTAMDLRAVWASSPNDIWVVGEKGTALHFDGTAWRAASVAGETTELFAVWGTVDGDVWLAGDGMILRRSAER